MMRYNNHENKILCMNCTYSVVSITFRICITLITTLYIYQIAAIPNNDSKMHEQLIVLDNTLFDGVGGRDNTLFDGVGERVARLRSLFANTRPKAFSLSRDIESKVELHLGPQTCGCSNPQYINSGACLGKYNINTIHISSPDP